MKEPQHEQSLLSNHEQDIQISHQIEKRLKQAIIMLKDQGTYQIFIIIFTSICFFLVLYSLMASSFFFMNPIFECNGQTVPEDEACLKLDQCQIKATTYTVTADNRLYCQRKDTRILLQSMAGIGSMLGVIFVNFASDLLGRKISLIVGLFTQCLASMFLLMGSFWDNVPLFVISSILYCFSGSSLLSVSFVYVNKFLSKVWTSRSILIMNAFGVIAQITIIFYTTYSSWKTLSFYGLVIPSVLLFFAGIYYLIEDPIILYSRNRTQECKQSLKSLAKWNKTQENLPSAFNIIGQMQQEGLQLSKKKGTWTQKLKYFELLINKKVLLPIICLGIHQFGSNFLLYSLNFSISQVGYSYSITMMIFGFAQFFGVFPLMKHSHKVPRKKALIIVVLLQTVFCLPFYFSLDKTVQTVFLFIIRFVSASQYVLYIYFAVESFPQHIQSTGLGIVEFMSQASKLLAPLLTDVARNLGLSPVFCLGIIIAVLMLLPLFPLKETMSPEEEGGTTRINENQTSLINSQKTIENQ